jgi:hypothetical protein
MGRTATPRPVQEILYDEQLRLQQATGELNIELENGIVVLLFRFCKFHMKAMQTTGSLHRRHILGIPTSRSLSI